jgi:hypothetical protein
VYQVELVWSQPCGNLRQLRGEVFALVGRTAESATYVHPLSVADDMVVYDICTGMLDGHSPFKSHGHLIRLTVRRR